MPDVRPNISNFSSGEISPKFYTRTDLQQYYQACKTLTNFIIGPIGGIQKRSGTRFIHSFGTNRASCSAYSGNIGTVSKNGRYLICLKSYSGGGNGRYYWIDITTATEAVNEISKDHNYDDPDYFDQPFLSEFMYDSLSGLRVLWIVNKNTFPVGLTNVTLAYNIGDADDINILSTTVWDTTVIYEPGELVRRASAFYVCILQSTGNQPPNATFWTLLSRDSNNVYREIWPLSKSTISYPAEYITKHESRIIMAGTTNEFTLVGISGSQAQSAKIFKTGNLNDNQPYSFIVNDTLPPAKWIIGKTNLFFGAAEAEFRIPNVGGITPTNIQIQNISKYGSGNFAVQVQDTLFFSSKDNKKLWAINFQDTSQDYIANDVSVLYEHLFTAEIKYLKYQRTPQSIIWVVLTDGTCFTISYDRTTGVNAASKVELGGEVDAIEIQDYNDREVVAFVIKRGTNYYLEILGYGDDAENIYLDSYIEVDMTGITDGTVAGLSHLEGEEVYVKADGFVFGLYTVTSGEVIILGNSGDPYVPTNKTVHAGLPYTSEVETVTLEAKQGSGLNEEQSISKITSYVFETNSLQVADQSGNYYEVPFRDALDPLDASVPLKTGYKEVSINGNWNRTGSIKVKSDKPLPCNILSLIPEVNIRGEGE